MRGSRRLVGIAGKPGAGKATYARALVASSGVPAAYVPMDAGALAIPPEAELVVTEGNYLLLDRTEWLAVRAQLDEVILLETDDEVRRARLVARHVEFGKTPAEAESWVSRVDDANAVLVAATAHLADRVVSVPATVEREVD